ncbi:hypothetical protein GCM10009605_19380 [Nocardiopsis composta]
MRVLGGGGGGPAPAARPEGVRPREGTDRKKPREEEARAEGAQGPKSARAARWAARAEAVGGQASRLSMIVPTLSSAGALISMSLPHLL